MSFLVLNGLRKRYADGTEAVMGVDLSIAEGEFVVLLGPSGCGKTTTLRMVAGLESVTAGTIMLAGEDVTHRRPAERDVGFVFQFYALYPHWCVRDNIAFPLEAAGLPRVEREERLARVVERLGLAPLLKRYPGQLSGGDQQRVSLARAMVRRPRLYLMDEPLGTLDADQRLEMREFIRAQQLELGVTTIYVTHDQEEAMSLADRIVVMAGGALRQVGSPLAVYDLPADAFVASFVGSPGMNFMPGEIVAGQPESRFRAGGAEVPLPKPYAAGPATLGIRPEYVQAAADGALGGTVANVEFLGASCCVYVDTAGGRVVMRQAAGAPRPRLGEALRLSLDPEHVRLFVGPEQRLAT